MNRLLIIGPSHYCEKARWGLDLARIDYELEGHPPFLHMLPVKRSGGTRQVPVLIADGKPVDGSDQNMSWIQAHPDAAWSPYGHAPEHHARIQALETEWGRKLGVLIRLVAYYHLLPHKALILPSMSYFHGCFGLRLWRLCFAWRHIWGWRGPATTRQEERKKQRRADHESPQACRASQQTDATRHVSGLTTQQLAALAGTNCRNCSGYSSSSPRTTGSASP